MKYDELGNKIVANADTDGFITIDFGKFKSGWGNGTITNTSRPDNDNGHNGAEPSWRELVNKMPKQASETKATDPKDLRRAKRVLDVIENMDIVDEAKQFRIDRDKPEFDEPEVIDCADFLDQDDNPVGYKIADLWPNGSNVLFAAPAKFGKSTVMMNMIRSLLTGEAFLGYFDCEAIAVGESLLLVDLEMNPDRVRAELRSQISFSNLPRERQAALKVACLRGQAAKFDITDVEVRAYWVAFCQENNVTTLILDPLAPLLGFLNTDENDNTMINRFFQQLDEFKIEAGIKDMIVVHHCGHMADYRPRGASRFNDWPDALWGAKLTDPNDPANSSRTFHARGRDVGEDMGGPGEVKRDPQNSKVLYFEQGTGVNGQSDINATQVLLQHIAANPGISRKDLFAWAQTPDAQGNTPTPFKDAKLDNLLHPIKSTGQIHACNYRAKGSPEHYAPDLASCQNPHGHAD